MLSGADLGELLTSHHDRGADVTLHLVRVADPRAFGCVPTDEIPRIDDDEPIVAIDAAPPPLTDMQVESDGDTADGSWYFQLMKDRQSVAEIRDRIRSGDITCVFAEPQFDPALIRTVIEGTEARAGTLDPLGSHLTPGPDLYPELLRNLADNMSSCLAGE